MIAAIYARKSTEQAGRGGVPVLGKDETAHSQGGHHASHPRLGR